MKLYNIKDEYIDYLRKYDYKVAYNKNEKRPYVGIVLEYNKCNYFVPFSSPKAKHKKMKNGIDFRKIKNGDLGAINFNNMIPVDVSALLPIDFDSIEDEKYRNLLIDQLSYIEKDEQNIQKTASNLRNLFNKDAKERTSIENAVIGRSCDLVLLEEKCKEYSFGEPSFKPKRK